MKNLDKYVKDLTERIKINYEGLKISEKGTEMEKKAYMGFYIPYPKTLDNDIIIGSEVDEMAPIRRSSIVVWRITPSGFELISAKDQKFEHKVRKMIEETRDKVVYTYDETKLSPNITRLLQRRRLKDLEESVERLSLHMDKSDIPVPWDPIDFDDVSEAWRSGDTRIVNLHCVAEALRIYSIYLIVKVTEMIRSLNTVTLDQFMVKGNSNGKIKLPKLVDSTY
ncbi:hypothetical protein [Candidatus Aciduliprofundum boonei]|uniref:Uncharacterized protein n=1 Tax=Aciduliprofundum boonei (strain DSM 19572 / T469) TaxID=439481 RepID=B5IHA8_ACIB4|nr:hypothetical protein [Candidatus Aciduliprofundum boonei]ADD08853.1 hypothetical protein Aboo_1044 [Aciduliprofundum boonei T469]EDY34334.1 hypothetical protein ABOONEI_963 [Aciduliprofundum boonei T469]HII55607.1 hypothetical protein [Candidatus Aciduliprofundum boonei]